jgi:hypothetical protein
MQKWTRMITLPGVLTLLRIALISVSYQYDEEAQSQHRHLSRLKPQIFVGPGSQKANRATLSDIVSSGESSVLPYVKLPIFFIELMAPVDICLSSIFLHGPFPVMSARPVPRWLPTCSRDACFSRNWLILLPRTEMLNDDANYRDAFPVSASSAGNAEAGLMNLLVDKMTRIAA